VLGNEFWQLNLHLIKGTGSKSN